MSISIIWLLVLLGSQCIGAATLNVKGAVYLPGTQEYNDVLSANWNLRVQSRAPAMIVYAQNEDDIISCIEYAKANGLKIAVRGGGHSVRSIVTGSLVIDTSSINYIRVDSENVTVRIGAGSVIAELQKIGFAVPAGDDPGIGMVGQSLLGGMGYSTRKYGLLVDNIVSYRMVKLSGEVVNVSANENPDLFWALRGGGGRFGIVTEMQIKVRVRLISSSDRLDVPGLF